MPVRRFAEGRPLSFCALITVLLFGVTFLCRAVLPAVPSGDIAKLPQKTFQPPEGLGLILSDMKSPDTLFWALAIGLGLGLLVWTGWWDDAGFTRPSRWRNMRLLAFPLLVCALTLSGGRLHLGSAALVSTFLVVLVATLGEEIIFRGLLWRALAPDRSGTGRDPDLLARWPARPRHDGDGRPLARSRPPRGADLLRRLHLRRAPLAHHLHLARRSSSTPSSPSP